MAKLKTIKIKNKTYKYKTIPSLAKQLNKSKAQTKALVKINTLIPKLKKRQIQFKGKSVKFQTPAQLAKKLNITDIQAVNLLEDYRTNQTKRYIEVNGDIAKYDLKDKPLVLQDFNIKKTSNKQFIGAKTIKKIQIKTSLPKDKEYNLFVVTELKIVWSNDEERRTYSFNTNSTIENLNDKLYDIVLGDYLGGAEPASLIIESVKIYNKQNGQSFKLVNMELREEKPLDICNLFNEVIPNENSSNCVNNYISKIWKSKNIPKKDKVLFKSLHTTEDLKLFCEKRHIKMVAYNINGKVISSNYPTKKNKTFKNLIFIAYNNHLYPLQNQTLNKTSIIDCELVQTEDIRYAFKKVLKQGILPSNIKITEDELSGFCVGKKHYFNNPTYHEAKLVLDTFGLSDHMSPYTNLKNVLSIVEKLYLKKENLNSFMPQANRFIKGGFLYKSEDDHEGIELETIDKNKSYPHALKKLPFLIKTDIRYCKRYNLNSFKDIINPHLYLIKVKKSSYLLPKNGIYTGSYLKYCKKEQLQFTIIEGLETQSVENYLSEMIIHLYEKLPKHIFKECMVIYIGKFANTRELRENINVKKLANQEETLVSDGVVIPFNKDYNFICENTTAFNIYNRKPIHIQILDQARKEGYEMLKKLSIKHSDIIQIKTDSITFKKNKTTDRKLKKLISTSIDGWKYEKYTALKCPSVMNNCLEGFGYDLIENNNVLVQAYAGAGKTYHIINEVIPEIENYLILTPSHASIKEYRKNKLNCKVIQYYTFNRNEIPTEQTIIIDEIGMVDRQGWDFIYKCILMGKTIMAYGDFKQLLPVSSRGEMNSSLWIDLAFKHKKIMKTNHRNVFTKEYYDSLINGKKSYIKNEVVKYSTPMKDAELILVFRNTTRHAYNKMMCDTLAIPYVVNKENETILNKDNLKIGTKIICIDNKLGKKTIYNKFCYTIKEINEDAVIITDDLDNITIDKEELEHFSFAYARTIYSIQGASIKSYHYAKEDLYFIDNRTAYTTISRIKNI